ncbi:unnamed protein product [Ilex paraguariensis]|uniref:Uncharacterized protein n=1 Tax=Ilex paraguariensis TaxID=185542 RepID=A0ABC8UDV2_9AQUA
MIAVLLQQSNDCRAASTEQRSLCCFNRATIADSTEQRSPATSLTNWFQRSGFNIFDLEGDTRSGFFLHLASDLESREEEANGHPGSVSSISFQRSALMSFNDLFRRASTICLDELQRFAFKDLHQ